MPLLKRGPKQPRFFAVLKRNRVVAVAKSFQIPGIEIVCIFCCYNDERKLSPKQTYCQVYGQSVTYGSTSSSFLFFFYSDTRQQYYIIITIDNVQAWSFESETRKNVLTHEKKV